MEIPSELMKAAKAGTLTLRMIAKSAMAMKGEPSSNEIIAQMRKDKIIGPERIKSESRAEGIIEALANTLHVMRAVKNVKVHSALDRHGAIARIDKTEFRVGDKIILGDKEITDKLQWVQIATGAKGKFLISYADIAKMQAE